MPQSAAWRCPAAFIQEGGYNTDLLGTLLQRFLTAFRGMSIARVQSFAFSGIEAVPVEVQVQVSSGLPAFLVVGLPDKAVGEARERVRAALTAMGLALPPRRVLINLAPADLLKEGSHFDLPIALCVLAAMDVLPREDLAGTPRWANCRWTAR